MQLFNKDIETGHGAIALQKIIDSHPDFRVRMEGVGILRVVREALRSLARAKEELLHVFGTKTEDGGVQISTISMEAPERAACLKAFDDLSNSVVVDDFTPLSLSGSDPKVAETLAGLSADEMLEAAALIHVS